MRAKGRSPLKTRLDHLFVLTASEAQASLPAKAGFSVYRCGPHRGGGTGNVVYRLRDALLELAYPIDPAEIAALGAIGFAERWQWQANGYLPFGVVFQVAVDDEGALPFETWSYAPPFLPGESWTLGRATPHEPLYMCAPYAPDHPSSPGQPALVSVEIVCPGIAAPSQVAEFLAATGVCEIVAGERPLLTLTFAESALPSLDLRPALPLVLRNAGPASVTDVARNGF